MNLMQAPALYAKVDLAIRNARTKQLRTRHDAALPGGESSDGPIDGSTERFATHAVVNPAFDRGAPAQRQ